MADTKTMQGAQRTEYVLRANGQPIFSHSDKAVCAAKLSATIVSDHINGVTREFTKEMRVISYPELEVFPEGDESRREKGIETVSEGWDELTVEDAANDVDYEETRLREDAANREAESQRAEEIRRANARSAENARRDSAKSKRSK